MDVHVILPQDGMSGGPPTSLPCHPYPHDAASFHTLARSLVTPLCLHSVSAVGGSMVVVGGEVCDDDKEPVVRALALAACGELFSMLHAAREAFPEEVGEPRLRFSAAFLEAEGGVGGGEGIIDALVDLPGLPPPPPTSPRLHRASPFTPGAGTPVAPLPSSRGPHISDDPSCGHGIVGIREIECTSIEGVAQVLFALPTSPKEAPPIRRHHALLTITLLHPPPRNGSASASSSSSNTPTSPGGGGMGHPPTPFSRLCILRLARASLPPPPPGAPRATPPPCPTWVSAVAEVLTAVENRTINVPFAASRATLLLKSVLTGKGKGVFLALPPSSPPMVATQTLQFARRLGAASHTLFARDSTTSITKGGAAYNTTPIHSGPPSSQYLPNASPRHAALAMSTVVGAAAVGFVEREAEGGRGGSSGQGFLKSPGGAMPPPPLQSLREEEEEEEEEGGGRGGEGEEELNGDNFTVLSPSPPRPTFTSSVNSGGNSNSSSSSSKKHGYPVPPLLASPSHTGDVRSSSSSSSSSSISTTSDLTSLLSVDLANTSRALFAGTLSALEASRAECLSLQGKLKSVVEERERAVAAAEAATVAALAAAQAATGNPSVVRGGGGAMKPVNVFGAAAGGSKGRGVGGGGGVKSLPLIPPPPSQPPSSSSAITTSSGASEEELATLKATVATLTSKNKSLTRAASDYEVYRGVVEASLARLQGDVARVAGERDALGKQVEELKVALSRERRACGTLKTKCAELEYKVVAFQSGSVGKGEAAAAVNALKGALEEARVAGGVAEATNQELKAAAGEELELLRWRVEELSRALGDEVKKRGAVEAELDAARGQIMDKLSGDRSEGWGGGGGAPSTTAFSSKPPLPQPSSLQPRPSSQVKQRSIIASPEKATPQQQQQQQQQQRKASTQPPLSKPPQEWDGRGLASLMGANVTYAQTIPPLPPNTHALADALDDEEEASFATALGLLSATRPPSTSMKQQQQQTPPPPRQSIIQAFQAGASARERNRVGGGGGKQQQQQSVPPPKVPTPTSKATRGGAVLGASKGGAGKPPPPNIEQELGLEASFETAMLALLKK